MPILKLQDVFLKQEQKQRAGYTQTGILIIRKAQMHVTISVLDKF
jgi:hypothetical protein